MREKCARVLAAALMTGAVGFALAMPAFFGTAQDVGRSLTAPPSSLQRSVHVVASALSHPARAGRLEGTHPVLAAVRAAVVRSKPSHTSERASSRDSTTARQSKPDPTPSPTPDTRELANNTAAAAVSPPAPSRPAESSGDGKGKGKGKGHDKAKDKGKAPKAEHPPVPATTPPPAQGSPAPEAEKDHGHDKGKGHDKGHEE